MKFSIIIPTHGSITLLQKCIKSLRKYEKGNNYEVLVVDDGSHPKDQALLRNYCRTENIIVVCNKENKGFAHTINTGLKSISPDIGIILLCNNDIVFTHPILTQLAQSFRYRTSTAIIGALLSYPNGQVQHAGMHYSPHANAFLHTHKMLKANSPTVNKSRYCIAVTGALFAIRADAYKDLGPLNEDYFLACEDTHYCLRAWTKGFHVLYDPKIRAIHLEGGTRGKSTRAKLKANHKWARGEQESILKFQEHLELYDIKAIEHKIAGLNNLASARELVISDNPLTIKAMSMTQRKKIEVGSGYNPHPGYLHLDVRKNLPQIDYVCDFSKQRLPFKDGEVEEILANHVIEHISFRKLPFVLGEWSRVLGKDGKLILRTPNLRFIVETYLKGETTPEWPGDENYIKSYLSPTVTPAWWANIKLFSGQDYDANFHHVCFDFPMLKELLGKFGFKTVLESKFDRVFSPGELQVEAFKESAEKEWDKVIKNVLPPQKKALVIRRHAFGDVLMTTPIVKRLFDEGWEVIVATDPATAPVFLNNPYVKDVTPWKAALKDYVPLSVTDKVINLDLAYESIPKMHVIDAYSMVAFGDTETEHKLYFYPSEKEIEEVQNTFTIPYTVIHMGVGWENRTWSYTNWLELIASIDGKIVLVGNKNDYQANHTPDKIRSLVGKLSWHETGAIIKKAKLFIGPDSAPLHIAQALGTPAIGLFTCAKAEYRTTGALAVIPDIDCYGCLHDEPPPVQYCWCRRGDFKCLELITPEKVMEAVRSI